MSRTIDNRVVEMQFNNKQFEQGIAESRQSLKQLDKDLQFENAAQGLTNLNQAFDSLDLSNIENGVTALQNRFSAFGIFTMQVIERLSNSLINFATNSLSKVFGQIATGGINRAMNIENAKFQMQGLLKSQAEVDDVMAAVNKSVDGTAYGLDEAAKAASMFVATGYKTGKDVLGPLRAVAGVAAQTNSDYSRMADIFTTVAGNGRLMGQQLSQLSTYGLNAAATIAEWLNEDAQKAYRKELKITGKATESEIRDLVSKGKISFAMFSKAMEDAFGDHATDANKTFTGAMSNIKAALSRIGANFVQPLIEQEGPIVRMFNSLRTMINAINKTLPQFNTLFIETVTEITDTISKLAGKIEEQVKKVNVTTIVRAINNIIFTIKWLFGELTNSFSKFFKLPTMKNLNDLISGVQKLTLKIQNFITTNKNVIKIINGFAAAFNIIKNVFGAVYAVIKNIFIGLTPLGDQFFEILGKIGDSIVVVNNWITATDILNRSVNKINAVLKPFVELISSIYPIIKNTFKSSGGGAEGIISAFFGVITRGISSVIHSLEELLGIDLTKQLGWVINKLKDLKNVVLETAPFFNEFINFFKDLGKIIYNSFDSSEGGLEGLVNSVFNVLSRAVTTVMHAFEDLTGINVTKYIGNVIVFFRKAKETVLGARDGITELKNAIKLKWESKEFESIRELFNNLGLTFLSIKNTIANAINNLTGSFDYFGVDISKFGNFLGGLYKVLVVIGNAVATVLNSIWSAISPFLTDLTSALTEGDLDRFTEIFSQLFSVLAGFKAYQGYSATLGWYIDTLKSLPDLLNNLGAFENTIGLLGSLRTAVSNFIKNMKMNQIKSIATSILMIAAAAYLISKIPEDDLTRSMLAVNELIYVISGIAVLIGELEFKSGSRVAGTILALGVSILLMAAALKVLSKIDAEALQNSFNAVIGLIAGITGAVVAMTAVDGSLKKVPGTMIALGVAILLLAVSLKMLAKLDPDALTNSFNAVIGLIAGITFALAALMAVSSQGGKLSKAAGAIIAIGVAILIMSASLKMLAKLDPDALATSFGFMSLMLLEVVAALAVLALLAKNGMNVTMAAATMVIAAVAIAILGAALAKLTKEINPDNAAAALILLGIALAELAIALTFMQDSIGGAAALLIASVSILILAAAFKALASIDSDQLVFILIAMAAALAILVAAVIALTLIPGGAAVLVSIAASLLMIGLAFMAIGAGIALIGIGLMTIYAALLLFAATNTVVLANALQNFVVFLQGVRIIIPLIAAIILDLIEAIVRGFGARVGVFVDTLKTLLSKILDALTELMPKVGEFLVALLNMLFDVLDTAIPRIISFLEILLENVLSFLEWAVPRLLEFVINLLMGIWDVLGVKIPEMADHLAQMVINLINGLAEVIREREPELKEAINNLLQSVLDAILDILGLAPGSEPVGDGIFMDFIGKMCMGIESKKAELWFKVAEMIREAVQKVKDKFREAFDIGKNFIQGLINGIGSKISDLLDTVGNAGADVIEALVDVFDTHSPSRVTEKIGENVDQGLINGIKSLTSAMVKTAENSGKGVINKFSEIVNDIYDLVDSDMDFSPVISPVLDASDVENGMENINGMFNGYGLRASGTYSIANNLDSESADSEEIQNQPSNSTIVNFTQNNNSPKSLDRIDIYRDTKKMLNNPAIMNLFST